MAEMDEMSKPNLENLAGLASCSGEPVMQRTVNVQHATKCGYNGHEIYIVYLGQRGKPHVGRRCNLEGKDRKAKSKNRNALPDFCVDVGDGDEFFDPVDQSGAFPRLYIMNSY